MPSARLPWSWIAIGLGAAFTALTVAITWVEFQTYNTTSLDMAVYSQLVWNTANGHPLETTLLLQNRSHLAEHLALLLLPLGPLYGLAPNVRLLLLLQQAALAVSGIPLYLVARQRLGPRLATLCLAAYYLMPTMAEVALDAFYPIAFVAAPVGLAVALAISGRARAALLPCLLAVLFEEEAALLALGLAVYLLATGSGTRRLGTTLLLVGGAWLLAAEVLVMPRFSESGSGAVATRPEGHFTELRANPGRWIATVALSRLEPGLTRGVGRGLVGQPAPCADPGHCSALRWWLYPTGGLALLSPTVLAVAAPPAAALLLADRPGRFRRHWAAPMLPVIWLATIVGLSKLSSSRSPRLFATAAMLLATLVMFRLDSPLPLGSQFEAEDLVLSQAGADLAQLREQIPASASVAASRRGLAHLSNRRELYAFPTSDYRAGLWPPAELPRFMLLDLANADTRRELESVSGPLRADVGYRELERTPNALLLMRDLP